MLKHKLYATPFAKVYPYYIAKAERKGRTKSEVDELIRWLTGYTQTQFERHLDKGTTFEDFYTNPKLNPKRKLITGVICGIRIEEIDDGIMREMRYLDKLVDELAKGKTMEQMKRRETPSSETKAKSKSRANR